MRRIGVLMPAASDDQQYQAYLAAFLQGLAGPTASMSASTPAGAL